jgi:hypothetical protein
MFDVVTLGELLVDFVPNGCAMDGKLFLKQIPAGRRLI